MGQEAMRQIATIRVHVEHNDIVFGRHGRGALDLLVNEIRRG